MAILSLVAVLAVRVIVSAMCVAVLAAVNVSELVNNVVSLWGWTYSSPGGANQLTLS